MSDFARNVPYGATKPRPHNAVSAPEDREPTVEGPPLAVVPEAEAGESGAEVAAETEATDAEATDVEGAEETAETGADTVAEADDADEAEAVAEDAESDTTDEPTAEAGEPESPAPEPTLRGETTIADEVVEKVAGIAARKVPGVYDLGGDASRLVNTVRERMGLGEGSSARGISVKLSGRAATLAVTLVVEYGHAVYQVADQVRKDVGDAVEKMLGIEVTELNIVVDDVHVPDA